MDTIILHTFYVQGTLQILSVFFITYVNILHLKFLKNESQWDKCATNQVNGRVETQTKISKSPDS